MFDQEQDCQETPIFVAVLKSNSETMLQSKNILDWGEITHLFYPWFLDIFIAGKPFFWMLFNNLEKKIYFLIQSQFE